MKSREQNPNGVSNVASLPLGSTFSPRELVAGLKKGDQRVSAAFFDQYNGQVNRLVRRFLGPDDDHVDVVNTVFVEILESIGKLKEPQALTRWVSTVTIHTVRGVIRKRKYTRLFLRVTEAPEDYHEPTGESHDALVRIYKVLKTLGADEQIVFVLHYLEGYTYDEIAELRGWSIATAKRRGAKTKAAVANGIRGDQVLNRFLEEQKYV